MRALGLALAMAWAAGVAMAAEPDCHVGVYQFADGDVIDLGLTADGGLRWRRLDGRTGVLQGQTARRTSTLGWTKTDAGVEVDLPPCDEGRIVVAGAEAKRLSLSVAETEFEGAGGVKLFGRLVMPAGTDKVPVVVLGHGSEDTSATQLTAEQRLYPSQGVGVFVFDKRGTGGSTGKYSQDFHLLSDDVAAAVREARRLAGPRAARLGVEGGSQGGWVVPLAATKTPVDFVLVDYGLTVSPWEENVAETVQDLQAKGWGEAEVAKGREMAQAASDLMASPFAEADLAAWDAMRAKHQGAPWLKDLGGEFTGEFAKHSGAEIKAVVKGPPGPMADVGTTWKHDSLAVLRRLDTPLLWIIAGADTVAPPEDTKADLAELTREGRDVRVIEFPATEHGMREFTLENGERRFTRQTEGYTAVRLDWIKGAPLQPAYGRGRFIQP